MCPTWVIRLYYTRNTVFNRIWKHQYLNTECRYVLWCENDFRAILQHKTNFADFPNFCWHTLTQDKVLIVGDTLVAIIVLHAVLFEEKIIYMIIDVINTWNFLPDVNEMIVDSLSDINMW